MTTSCTTRPARFTRPLLQFRRRGTVAHAALGAFEQIERVGFDGERPALAFEFRYPLDPRKLLVQIRPAGQRLRHKQQLARKLRRVRLRHVDPADALRWLYDA